MAATLTYDTFKYKFVKENVLILIKKITEICSLGSNWQYSSIGSDNDFAQTRRQVVIWTNDGIVYRLIYASLGIYVSK